MKRNTKRRKREKYIKKRETGRNGEMKENIQDSRKRVKKHWKKRSVEEFQVISKRME
jgi:hypothetical protein